MALNGPPIIKKGIISLCHHIRAFSIILQGIGRCQGGKRKIIGRMRGTLSLFNGRILKADKNA
jgi:hypothetical protein